MLSVSSDAFRIVDLHTVSSVRQARQMLREVGQEPRDSRGGVVWYVWRWFLQQRTL